jgi:hypothetical protein
LVAKQLCLQSFYFQAGKEKQMNLKAKMHVDNQRKAAENKLKIRMAFLKEKGLDVAVIQQDALVRKIRAQVRKANFRMSCIAAQEKLNAEKAHAKAEKSALKKSAPEGSSAKIVKGISGKKMNKEKKEKENAD